MIPVINCLGWSVQLSRVIATLAIAEAEFAALDSASQIVDELAAKDQRQGFLIEQVIFFARDPLFTVF